MVTKRVQYRYDSVRNKIGMTDADGGLHTYTYDVMRRLTGVINPLGERTTHAYDLNGRRGGTVNGGSTSESGLILSATGGRLGPPVFSSVNRLSRCGWSPYTGEPKPSQMATGVIQNRLQNALANALLGGSSPQGPRFA